MKSKPSMPKRMRRQIKKNKKKQDRENVEAFFEAMRTKLKSGGSFDDIDIEKINKLTQ